MRKIASRIKFLHRIIKKGYYNVRQEYLETEQEVDLRNHHIKDQTFSAAPQNQEARGTKEVFFTYRKDSKGGVTVDCSYQYICKQM